MAPGQHRQWTEEESSTKEKKRRKLWLPRKWPDFFCLLLCNFASFYYKEGNSSEIGYIMSITFFLPVHSSMIAW